MLETLVNFLAEHAVLVPDAVSPRGKVLARHRVEEHAAAAKTTVAERGVALLLHEVLERITQLLERLVERALDLEVMQQLVSDRPIRNSMER